MNYISPLLDDIVPPHTQGVAVERGEHRAATLPPACPRRGALGLALRVLIPGRRDDD